jgi:PmbA protein
VGSLCWKIRIANVPAARAPFDAEGLPVAERAIVADGILEQWTLDLSTAAQLGLQSTGSAMRGPSGPPSPGVGNVTLTPGQQSREDLIRDMGTGPLADLFDWCLDQ